MTPIEEDPQTGSLMYTGDAVFLYRLTSAIYAVKIKTKTGMSPNRHFPTVTKFREIYNKYLPPNEQLKARNYGELYLELRELQKKYVDTGNRIYLGLPPTNPPEPQEDS